MVWKAKKFLLTSKTTSDATSFQNEQKNIQLLLTNTPLSTLLPLAWIAEGHSLIHNITLLQCIFAIVAAAHSFVLLFVEVFSVAELRNEWIR